MAAYYSTLIKYWNVLEKLSELVKLMIVTTILLLIITI